MGIDLYYVPGSAPCRNVLLAAKALGVELNLKLVNIMGGETKTPEFLKMNPQHTVPTLNDNGFCLWESRAIMTYLADQYGKNDSLYPKDPKKRAVVDQRLYFDMGTLYGSFSAYYYPNIFAGAPLDKAAFDKCSGAFELLEKFLEGQEYVAGNQMTIADLSILASVTTFEVMDFDFTPYKNVSKWLAKLKAEAPGYEEANNYGCGEFKKLVEHLKSK